MKIKKTLLKILVSLLFLGIILLKIDVNKTINTLTSIKPEIIILFPLIIIIGFLLNSFNIYILFKGINLRINYIYVFKSYISAWLFGKVSTGKSGELSILYFLSKKEKYIPFNKSAAVIFIDKIISFLVLLFISFFASLILFRERLYLILIIYSAIFIIVIAVLFSYKAISRIINFFFKRQNYLAGFTKNIKYLLKNSKKNILVNIIFTFIKHINVSFAIFIIFWAYGFQIPFIMVFLISGIEGIISQVPIAFMGLGVTEGAAVILYSLINTPLQITISVYIFLRIYSYFFAFVLYCLKQIIS
ncbi:flippase-like domain-containing protein [Candidatus Woesearchaeota archaeon]|nr:flippase-like domain-containing protein [Candidatus Woesearchaeota archaeon]